MTTLNSELPKDRYIWILISIMQTIREMDTRSTSATKIEQPDKTITDNDLFYNKDRLDFQIEMIKSLAG